jgi:solute carrier family 25 phosphate transporter 23/24/25/41
MICGGIAGMIAKTATNPLDRIRMLAQTGAGNSNPSVSGIGKQVPATHLSAFSLYRNIIQTEGIWGLWAGNGANLLRVFPSKAIVFASNDVYKSLLLKLYHSIDTNKNRDYNNADHINASPPLIVSFLAGGMSGMSATAVTYPLDLARGRIAGTLANTTTKTKDYSGILTTVALTVREEGVRALWRGALPTLLGAMPYEGIKFGTVGVLEAHVGPWLSSLSSSQDGNNGDATTNSTAKPLRKMLFGGIGGIMAGLLTYPNDTVRRLLQLQGSRSSTAVYTGYWDCVRQTYRTGGIQRFYRGIVVNIIRMAPNTAVQFGSYELLKQWTADWV